MVKKLKGVVALLTAAMLIFAGCNNLVNEATVTGASYTSNYDGTVSIFLGQVSNRTLAPDALTVDGTEIAKYVIVGESQKGYTLAATDLTVADVKGGTAKLEGVQLDD